MLRCGLVVHRRAHFVRSGTTLPCVDHGWCHCRRSAARCRPPVWGCWRGTLRSGWARCVYGRVQFAADSIVWWQRGRRHKHRWRRTPAAVKLLPARPLCRGRLLEKCALLPVPHHQHRRCPPGVISEPAQGTGRGIKTMRREPVTRIISSASLPRIPHRCALPNSAPSYDASKRGSVRWSPSEPTYRLAR